MRILDSCTIIWKAVQEILCYDAPEGAAGPEGEAGEVNINAKDTLSYCWRALKDSRYDCRFTCLSRIELGIIFSSQLFDAFHGH